MILGPRRQRFEQVKAGLTTAIFDGQIKPGEMLPSLRNLCTRYKVSLATVQRAIKDLKDEEWLVTVPCKGVMVTDPLPPVAHLMRLHHQVEQNHQEHAVGHDHDVVVMGQGSSDLKCLIHDKALLPLFEWAAREYADDCDPCSLRFEVRSLRGKDDYESVSHLDADLVLLPSYAVGRAARAGSITPANAVLQALPESLAEVPPGIMNMGARNGVLWGAPFMIGGMILAVAPDLCGDFDLHPDGWGSLEQMLDDLNAAPGKPAAGGALLFNMALPVTLLIAAGCRWPGIARMPDLLQEAGVHRLLSKMRKLAGHPAACLNRFDQWERADFARVAVRHLPSAVYFRDPQVREGSVVLPMPSSGALLTAYCMCVSARSVHPFEAWEWALRLAEKPFQARLAELGYDLPVNAQPEVRAALARVVGAENARRLMEFVREPAAMYGMGPEDVMLYMWEVLGNEVYRFVAGIDDYERMLERMRTKTERFLMRHAGTDLSGRNSTEGGADESQVDHVAGIVREPVGG